MTDIVTASDILNMYLYGQENAPSDLLGENLIRPTSAETNIQVTTQSYMDKLGRFALPAQFELIQNFFSVLSTIPVKRDSNGNVTYYTKSEMAAFFSMSSYGLVVRQYMFDDGLGDYAERTLIWNSGAYKISDNAQFWIDEDGTRHIENLAILPNGSDNFDLDSDSLPTEIANTFYLQDRLDPYHIGRKVNVDIVGPVEEKSYSAIEYNNDLQTSNNWTTPDPISSKNAIDSLLNDLNQSNVISPLDSSGRPLVYGTNGADNLSDTSENFPYYENHPTSGVAILGGAGNDTITGSEQSDDLRGGADNDIIHGNGGQDNINGGIGNDTLYGAGQNDNIDGDDGNDVIYGYDGVDYIGGGDGNDLIYGGLASDFLQGGADQDTIDGGADADTIYGGSGNDLLLGGDGADVLQGGDGNDTLIGGLAVDTLTGGNGSDELHGDDDSGVGDFLSGGDGGDRLYGSSGDTVLDADNGDVIFFHGVRLTGAVRKVSAGDTLSETGTYQNGYTGLSYHYDKATKVLTVSDATGSMEIDDFVNGEAGIALKTATRTNPPQAVGNEGRPTISDPLVLDLDGDGVEMTDINTTTVYFDTNLDGLVERVGWVAPDDGLLARDINGDGLINNLSELFGSTTKDGFTALAEFDSNADGKIDASDTIWSSLRVWQDANTDGDTGPGELKTMQQAGISQISLSAEPVEQGNEGNKIAFRGQYTKTNGTVQEVAAAYVQIAKADPLVTGDAEYQDDVYKLPDLSSPNDVQTLRSAMNEDPGLLADVTSLVENARTLSPEDFRASFEDILLRWAGVDSVDPDAEGPNVDGQHLAFIRKIDGDPQLFRGSDGTLQTIAYYPSMGKDVEARFTDLVNQYLLRFGSQLAVSEVAFGVAPDILSSPFAAIFNGTSEYHLDINVIYSAPEDIGFYIGRDASQAADPVAYLNTVMPFLQGLQYAETLYRYGESWAMVENSLGTGLSAGGLDNAMVEFALDRAHGTERTLVTGTADAESLFADELKPTTFIAGQGNDSIYGNELADDYVYSRGDGDDLIADGSDPETPEELQPVDRLLLVGINKEDVSIATGGPNNTDLILTINGTGGGVITLQGQLSGQGVEQVVFANGTYSAGDLATVLLTDPITSGNDTITGTRFNDSLDGLAGDDSISGGGGYDILRGNAGNDTLIGGDGPDTYVYNAGDGNDVIRTQSPVEYETLQLVGIDPNDVTIRRDPSNSHVIISIGGTQPGQITVEPQPGDQGIDEIRFDNNVSWNSDQIRLKTISGQATNGDDHLVGYAQTSGPFGPIGGHDELIGGRGNDTLEGLSGSDTYRYRLGDGDDTIIDHYEWNDNPNGLYFDDLNLADVSFERSGADLQDLIIHVNRPEGGSITISNAFPVYTETSPLNYEQSNVGDAVGTIMFADFMTITPQEIASQLLADLATDGADTLVGLGGDGDLLGLDGNDHLAELGDASVVDGGSGDDRIYAASPYTVVRGGLGNDIIKTYGIVEYRRGDGDDTLVKAQSLHLVDILPADVSFGFGATQDDLMITIGGDNPGSISVPNQWLDPYSNVSPHLWEVSFSDGSVMTADQIAQQLMSSLTTNGNDTIVGMGERGQIMTGSLGDDDLNGAGGSDTYVYTLGDGNDVIHDDGDDTDKIALHDIEPSDVTVTRDGNDAVLTITGSTGGSLRLTGQFAGLSSGEYPNIERIEFDNGDHWLASELVRRVTDVGGSAAVNGTSGNDTLNGTSANETYHGGAGDDTITDYGGSDVYLFAPGDGHDVITNNSDGSTNATVDILRVDALSSDIEISKTPSALIFKIISTGATVTVNWGNVSFVEFSNGERWDGDRIKQEAYVRGTSGNDDLIDWYMQSDDTFLAGGGSNDIIEAGGGNDTFIYRRGDGFLRVLPNYSSENHYATDTDTLWLKGFSPSEVTLSIEAPFNVYGGEAYRDYHGSDLVVRFNGQAGAVRIKQNFDQLSSPQGTIALEQIRFDDGTIWTINDILQRVGVFGTDVSDYLFANYYGSPIIQGFGGNDKIYDAHDGNIIRWAVGDGNDTLIGANNSASLNLNDVVSSDATLTKDGNALLISVGSETIRIESQFSPGGSNTEVVNGAPVTTYWDPGIGSISFSDTTITRADLYALFPPASTAGDDNIQGSRFADQIVAQDGSDTIIAGEGDDTLTGGIGDDYLNGGKGSDTYVWSAGDGDDQIEEDGGRFDGSDTLKLVGIDPSDVVLTRSANANTDYPYDSLDVEITSTGEVITISNQYLIDPLAQQYMEQNPIGGGGDGEAEIPGILTDYVRGLEKLVFDDGTTIDLTGLGNDRSHANPDNWLETEQNSELVIDPADLFDNDIKPSYASLLLVSVNAISNGSVSIAEDGSIAFTPDEDFVGQAQFSYTVSDGVNQSTAVATVSVNEQDPYTPLELYGTSGPDVLTGRLGDDTIYGAQGDDTLTGSAGYNIIDGGDGTDTVTYAGNSTDYDIALQADGLLWTYNNVDDSGDDLTNVEVLRFDGDSITINVSDLTKNGTSADDTLVGSAYGEVLAGNAGNDVITGSGGYNTIDGGDGIDTAIYSGNSSDYSIYRQQDGTIAVNAPDGYGDVLSNVELLQFDGDTVVIEVDDLPPLGTSADDIIVGTDRTESLFGYAGNDQVLAGGGRDYVDAGEGADIVDGGAGNDFIYGGDGDDSLKGGSGNDLLLGGNGEDTAVYAGNQLDYTLSTAFGQIVITDDELTTDGDDGVDTLQGIENAQFKDGAISLAAPIALDLDGDGVELVDRRKSKAKFDWDGDGKRDKTGWVGKDDGLLAFDRNGDGTINAADELSFVGDKAGAKSDLDGLSAFDTNEDGIFSSSDEKFAQFQVWRDKNGNGKSDAGELMTLADTGIASINLAGTAVNQNWGWGDNLVINTGSFTKTDGSEHAFSDIALNYSETKGGRSRYAPSVAASRFAEAIASFRDRGGDEVTLGKHDMELTKVPVFAGEHSRYI
jgi:Ca2+-binding RTX toxin-like protein